MGQRIIIVFLIGPYSSSIIVSINMKEKKFANFVICLEYKWIKKK